MNTILELKKTDPRYPEQLLSLPLPPFRLYVRGNLDYLSHTFRPPLAVIGSRKMSSYAASILPRLLGPVIDAGAIVISGLAYGVDSLAHRCAVEKQQPTIAVIGSGCDDESLYPKPHRDLAEKIINYGGCIISEYPPGTPPLKQHFIARNRIIAGLCKALLVAECAEKSGTRTTVDFALEYNRDIYAIPGPVLTPNSVGTNTLIKEGAGIVTTAEDILIALSLPLKQNISHRQYSPEEYLLIQLLKDAPLGFEELVSRSNLATHTLMAKLSQLEIAGVVKNNGQHYYLIDL